MKIEWFMLREDDFFEMKKVNSFKFRIIAAGIAFLLAGSAIAAERVDVPKETKTIEEITKAVDGHKGFGDVQTAQFKRWGRQIFAIWYCPFSGRAACFLRVYYYDYDHALWTQFVDQLIEGSHDLSAEMPSGEETVIFRGAGGQVVLKESVATFPSNRPVPSRVRIVAAQYGQKAQFVPSLLRYPEFIVRFVKRDASLYDHLRPVTYAFDVLDEKEQKITAFIFTLSGSAGSTASFEVGGKIFVAELSRSTAGQPVTREVPPKQNGKLAEGEIVVWDESTARTGNLQLLEIWLAQKG